MIATLGRLALAAVALLVLRRALRRGAAPPRRRRHPSPWRVASSRVALALRAHRRERAMLRVLGRPLPSLGLPPLPPELLGALFVGHTAPDLDSIAAAIGAACLFAGTPAVAGELNAESAFALAHWGLPCPAPIGELLASDARARVCLVDHNQRSQLAPALRACPDRVCGVIDHHALQDDAIVTAAPIFATLRPWGSAASIVAHMALEHGVRLPPPIAGVLLSAILSDTLNLRSPTTTDYDRKLLSLLATLSATADVERLARHQFRAKSKALDALSSHALLVGDLKVFELGGGRSSAWAGSVGVSVVETTAPDGLLARAPGLAREMIRLKSEEGLQLLFAFIVDVSALRSHLVLCGRAEASLAHASYGGDARDADGRDGDEADGHPGAGGVAERRAVATGGRT
ncbi:hypothetical protein KFE25_003649 [Diacronema lutheri]|uniref:inorganic diphosphatase n=1 Tax=Diacronema lutheri TaxID=2081491 RepID=A0A8J5XLG6_DIALT|nr:hypothetical protein KFE25_003649 [Diacronema lutheri]